MDCQHKRVYFIWFMESTYNGGIFGELLCLDCGINYLRAKELWIANGMPHFSKPFIEIHHFEEYKDMLTHPGDFYELQS